MLALFTDDGDVAALAALRDKVVELGGFNDTGARLLSATASLLENGSKALAVLGGMFAIAGSAAAIMMGEYIAGLAGFVFTYPVVAGVHRGAYMAAKRLLRAALKREAGPLLGATGGASSPVALPAPPAKAAVDDDDRPPV